jgi:cell volume regulation protein A
MVWVLKRVGAKLPEGMHLLLVIAVAALSYALSEAFEGNGYLSTYLCGIILGNAKIPKRSHVVTLFDSIDWLAQIIIFFLLGFMAIPEKLPVMILPAVGLIVFLIFIARPLAVFSIFPFFKVNGVRNPVRKGLFISWAGLRGAASIVFVFLALAEEVALESDLFSLIFIVALLSISIQGTLFPVMAKRLDMVDEEADYTLSFNDYQQLSAHSFFKIHIDEENGWAHKTIRDIKLEQSLLIVLLKRDGRARTPRGDTVLLPGDVLVLSGESYSDETGTQITQIDIDADNPWAGKLVKDLELPDDNLIVSIVKHNGSAITPKGWVRIEAGDTLTLFTLD